MFFYFFLSTLNVFLFVDSFAQGQPTIADSNVWYRHFYSNLSCFSPQTEPKKVFCTYKNIVINIRKKNGVFLSVSLRSFLCVSIFYERGCRLWKIRRERRKNTRIFCRCVLFLYHCLLNTVSIDPIQGFINLRSKCDQVAEVPLGGRVVAQSERRSRTVDSRFFSPIINSNISQKVIASDWGRGRSDSCTRYKISAYKRGVRRVPMGFYAMTPKPWPFYITTFVQNGTSKPFELIIHFAQEIGNFHLPIGKFYPLIAC